MKRMLFLSLCGLLLLSIAWLATRPQPTTALPLRAPTTDPTFLHEEAGISAYVDLGTPIRLDYVAPKFRTIEDQTAEYIIGWVDVEGSSLYDINYDVHVYVQADGWMIAYYPPTEPVSKIFNFRGFSFSPTMLERGLSQVLAGANLILPPVTYYDFRYPEATNMLWIQKNGGTFYLTVPSAFTIYERSWEMMGDCYSSYTLSLWVDNVEIVSYAGGSWNHHQGIFYATQLIPDLEHKIQIDGSARDQFLALAIVYRDTNATP